MVNLYEVITNKLELPDPLGLLALLGKGLRHKNKQRLKYIVDCYGCKFVKPHSILSRVSYDEAGWQYCANQSYPDEIRLVRRALLGELK